MYCCVENRREGQLLLCLNSDENVRLQPLILDQRPLNCTIAVPRQKIDAMKKEKETKVPKDNRNLHLLRFSGLWSIIVAKLS